jgi:hypothetical protein
MKHDDGLSCCALDACAEKKLRRQTNFLQLLLPFGVKVAYFHVTYYVTKILTTLLQVRLISSAPDFWFLWKFQNRFEFETPVRWFFFHSCHGKGPQVIMRTLHVGKTDLNMNPNFLYV